MQKRNYGPVIIILLLTLFGQPCAGQGSISIKGKITAADSRQPLRGVSISINRKGVGTATNAAGLFSLMIPAANLNDTLKLSHIGFKTQFFPVAKIKNGDELNVAFERNNTVLNEVTIYDAQWVIKKAIAKISDNYINHPHIIRGFYRMYTYKADAPLELSEAVFDVFNFGYTDKRADLFKLVKARNQKNERDFGALEFGQKPNSVFEADMINHIYASGLLNASGLSNHEFTADGIADVKGYTAYQIKFKEKPGVLDRTYRGTLYIDTKTFAFIYFDFGLSPSGMESLGYGSFAKRAVVNNASVELDLKHDNSKISYQEVGHKWVLSSVEGDDELDIKDSVLNRYFKAQVKFNYQVTAVDTAQTDDFGTKFGRNESINSHESGEGESFWKAYNILLSDYNTEDVFKQIRTINQLNKLKPR